MAYRVLHGMATMYLNQLVPLSDLPSRRRRLRSSSTLQLLVPPYRLTTIGRRSFPDAASIVWNSLPVHLQSSPSLFTFQQWLKTLSLSTIIPRYRHLTSLHYATVDFIMAIDHFSHIKNHWLIDGLIDWLKCSSVKSQKHKMWIWGTPCYYDRLCADRCYSDNPQSGRPSTSLLFSTLRQ